MKRIDYGFFMAMQVSAGDDARKMYEGMDATLRTLEDTVEMAFKFYRDGKLDDVADLCASGEVFIPKKIKEIVESCGGKVVHEPVSKEPDGKNLVSYRIMMKLNCSYAHGHYLDLVLKKILHLSELFNQAAVLLIDHKGREREAMRLLAGIPARIQELLDQRPDQIPPTAMKH